MGHDYHFDRMRLPSALSYPIPIMNVREEWSVTDNKERIERLLCDFPGVVANPPFLGWHTPDGGSLTFIVGDHGGVLVDTHAGLDFVIAVYEHLRRDAPDWVIVDPQTGFVHDPSSLRQQLMDRQKVADDLRRKLGL